MNAKKEPAMGRSGRRGIRHKGPETGEILVSSKNKRKVKCVQHTEPRGGSERGPDTAGERPVHLGLCEAAKVC